MIYLIVFILALAVLVADIAAFFTVLLNLLRKKTEIIQYIKLAFIMWALCELYSVSRFISIYLIGQIPNELLDTIFFISTFVAVFAAFAALLRIISILSRQSGVNINPESDKRKESYMRMVSIIVVGIVAFINVVSYYKTPIDARGFYLYQLNPYVFLITSLIYFPLIFFIFKRTRLIFKKIQDKELRNHLIILIAMVSIWTINIHFYIGIYPVLPSYYILTLIHFSLFLFSIVFYTVLFRKHPGFMEDLSTYFCVKSLYLIKDSGQTILGLDFQEFKNKDYRTQQELLLGGFLYAISSGLEFTTTLKGKLKTLVIGDTTLIIKYGKYTFGVLFVTEHTETIHEHFDAFMEKFEAKYENALKNWTGEISKFKINEIEELLEPYFKYY